ncbi:transcription factor mef2A [Condylostylus longicornis]|uniref:transcription factor mef2A n=1 Tax=Condylostylus longicornis TaxID=2530218 RepID=UPI00244DB4A3|nr:transcription factor mef2A [Condylostylus longicornis]XP_055373248.1 transcription factor mef2A [Condylostylus longicornis]
MAQHNSSQSLHQSQSQQQQPAQQQQQQQQQQQNGLTQAPPQVVAASQQNNNLAANYPHHYQIPGGVYVPSATPHGGAIYSVMPTALPGNVFVNNVTANVNLHGAWATHPAYIPAGQTFIPASNDIQQNVASIEPALQPIVSQQNNNTIARNGNRRNRNNSNPRNNSVNRRNDYNQRPHLNSPVPQDIANANGIDPSNQTLNQSYHHPYGYPQFACHQPQFFNHVPPQQVSHSQAQQATGAPLYLTSMYAPGPHFFNYPVIISPAAPAHMLSQSAPQSQEYQLGEERNPEGVVDQHGQPIHINVASGNMIQPQLWNPHEIPIEYQEEYHVIGNIPNNEGNEDINHNPAVSITDSDTPSMISPSSYSIHYDPNLQLIEAQQHMSSLQIYDQHAPVNEDEIHQQQQIIQDQQNEQNYPRMHEQVVMISQEVSVYEQEPVCDQADIIQGLNSPLQQHIEQQNVYHQQYQQHNLEQGEEYPQQQPQYRNASSEDREYKDRDENHDFNQNVPNIQNENGMHQDNVLCAQDIGLNTNSNENISVATNCEGQLSVTMSEMISEENIQQFEPAKEFHKSLEALKVEEKVIKATSTNVQIQPQQPQTQITTQAVLLPYQPFLPNQSAPQSTEIQTNQILLPQVKAAPFIPPQITKKTTASVAVTATPTQQHITTHVGLSNNHITTIKPEFDANISPPTSVNLQSKINISSTQNGVQPHRDRRTQSGAQVEQKSIASTAVPHQIQENNYLQSNNIIQVEVKKSELPIIDQNIKKTEKKEEVAASNMVVSNKEIDTKSPNSTVQQPQSGPKSWASLFNNTVPIANNHSLVNTTSNNNSASKKPVAKVLPFEGTANVKTSINPGVLSYSAASAQGASSSNNKPSVSTPLVSSSPNIINSQTNGVKSGKSFSNQQNISGDNSDEWTIKYADFLKKYKTDFSPVSLKPRGLKNPNNYCFINAVLQALIGCSPLYNLLKSAPKQSAALHLDKSKIPTINAMSQLISEFNTLPFGVRLINRRDRTQKQNQKQINSDELVGELQTDSAFEASPIYKLWNSSRPDIDEGRQGDAEEFLSYVLNKLNDEMLEIIKLMAKPVAQVPVQQNGNAFGETDEGGDDDWQMIYNNKNKGSVTRQTDFGKTPISDIFRGELRSRLQREGEHSTDVIQPFFTLQLNIEKAVSVREALEILVGRDQLEGVTCSKTNQEVVAWQQMNLEKLPLILIVHLKFFDYKSDGCTKIVKQFEFPLELKIDTKILASKKYSAKQKLYRLFAVVYHDGKEAIKGHYISDVYHSGYSNWLRYDDANVKPIGENSVLRPRGLRVPYLLFYRRCDTIPATSTTSTPQQQHQQPQQQHQHGSTHSK